jgi:hypothetical protein
MIQMTELGGSGKKEIRNWPGLGQCPEKTFSGVAAGLEQALPLWRRLPKFVQGVDERHP